MNAIISRFHLRENKSAFRLCLQLLPISSSILPFIHDFCPEEQLDFPKILYNVLQARKCYLLAKTCHCYTRARRPKKYGGLSKVEKCKAARETAFYVWEETQKRKAHTHFLGLFQEGTTFVHFAINFHLAHTRAKVATSVVRTDTAISAFPSCLGFLPR